MRRDYSLVGADGRLAIERGLAGADWYRSPIPRKRLKELTSSASFERALEAAEGDGEPEPLDLELDGARVHGNVHVAATPMLPRNLR